MSTFISHAHDVNLTSRKLEDRDMVVCGDVAWGDLLGELLSMISDRLGLIDLLSFRSVCKSWRCASTNSSAEIESEINSKPSFLVYGEDDKFDFYYASREMKMYSITIPELEKSICLASNHGWLLISKQDSIFFFCPFTRAKIDLPPFPFPNADISRHFFVAFSAPPTSPDCFLLVVNYSDYMKLELHVLRRGASDWIKEEDYNTYFRNKIVGFFYDTEESAFCFVDDMEMMFHFSLKEKNWERFRIIDYDKAGPETVMLEFYFEKEYFSYMKEWSSTGRLEEKTPIAICGTTIPATRYPMIVCNQSISVTTGVQHLKGIWFHPRAFKVSTYFRF